MIIDVQELRERKEPLILDHTFRPDELGLRNHLYVLRSPVALAGSAEAVAALDVRLRGKIRTDLDLVCGRCLKNFQKVIEKSFDLTYVPNEQMSFGEEVALSYDDLDVGLFSDARIDLNSVIIEQIVLEIPMKPVCSSECRGLCAQCGADLNLGPCGCSRNDRDPRWSALTELRERLKN